MEKIDEKDDLDCGNTIHNPKNITKKKQEVLKMRFCFTLNNYTEDDIIYLDATIKEYCKVAIVAKEIGESGTPHLQGYIEFKKKNRPMTVFKLNKKIHWENSRGTKIDNVNYCSKDGIIIINIGCVIPRKMKLITPDRPYQKFILDIIKQDIDDRIIYWFYSDMGNVGKTQFSKYLSYYHNAVCLGGKCADVKNGIIDYVKQNGTTPELVIMPIPRCYNTDYLSFEAIENIKDMYFYSGKYEGGQINGPSPNLFIFSNEYPDISKLSADRWRIYKIDDKYNYNREL